MHTSTRAPEMSVIWPLGVRWAPCRSLYARGRTKRVCETSTVSPAAILALAALFAGGGGGARAAPPPRRVALGPMLYGNQCCAKRC